MKLLCADLPVAISSSSLGTLPPTANDTLAVVRPDPLKIGETQVTPGVGGELTTDQPVGKLEIESAFAFSWADDTAPAGKPLNMSRATANTVVPTNRLIGFPPPLLSSSLPIFRPFAPAVESKPYGPSCHVGVMFDL